MSNPLQDFAALAGALRDAWSAKFGDIAADALALEDLEAVLADLGVPDMAVAQLVTALAAKLIEIRVNTGYEPGQYWFYHAGPKPEGR